MTTANKRTYLVLDKSVTPHAGRLVKTISTARAVEHVVGERYEVRIATQDDLIFALQAGVKVEEPDANGAAQTPPNPGRRASDANAQQAAAAAANQPTATNETTAVAV